LKIQTSVLIDQPANKVFECLCDFKLLGLWNSLVIETEPDQPASAGGMTQPQIGFNYKARLKLLNQTWIVTYQIIEFEQNRLLTYKTTTGWLPGFVNYRLEPEGTGDDAPTRLIYQHDYELVNYFKPYETLLQKSLARQAETDLANLKDWLESGLCDLPILPG
jgi:uncharacterized protein YndB with AHSA1/START domain